MPLYEYECKQCSHRFEKIKQFSDAPEKVCPKCGGEVEQLLSAPAVQFKGAGWYVTDYAKKSGAPAKSGSGDAAAASAEKKTESTTTESKPAPAAAPEKKSSS